MTTLSHQCYGASMKRDEAISRFRRHEVDLKQLGVDHLYFFGSTVRDEARDAFDIDLFFDHQKGKLGLFELMDLKERAAESLEGNADIMRRRSLHPGLRKLIEDTAVLVF